MRDVPKKKQSWSLGLWITVACTLLLLCVPLLRLYRASSYTVESTALLSPRDIKGVDLIHNDIPYSLNFEQQKWLIHYINQGEIVNVTQTTPHPMGEGVVVYRFDSLPFQLVPRHDSSNKLVWQIQVGRQFAHITDSSDGELETFLTSAYDN